MTVIDKSKKNVMLESVIPHSNNNFMPSVIHVINYLLFSNGKCLQMHAKKKGFLRMILNL